MIMLHAQYPSIKGHTSKAWQPNWTYQCKTPMLPNFTHKQLQFMPAQHAKMSKIPYGNMIGHVLWPIMISRPDTLFATGILSQFITSTGPAHMKALK